MAPTLVASYKAESTAADATTLQTSSFTPSAGELLAVKVATADADQTCGTPSASGFTVGAWSSRVNAGTSGTSCRAAIFTAQVTVSAAGTVSVTFVNNRYHAIVVERWTGWQLDATPAVASSVADATSPYTTTITTEAAGSVVTWLSADWNGVSPAGATLSDSPGDAAADTYTAGQYTVFWQYQDAPSAGSNTFGISSDTGSPSVTLAALEIQASGGGGTTASAGLASGTAAALDAVPAVTAAAGLPSAITGAQQPSVTVADSSGPNYAGAASDLGGGSGSWTSPSNADGAPDTTYATWAVP